MLNDGNIFTVIYTLYSNQIIHDCHV